MTKSQKITVDGFKGTHRSIKIFDDWVVLGLDSPRRYSLYHACKDLTRSLMSVNLSSTCAHCGTETPKGVKVFMKLMKVNP